MCACVRLHARSCSCVFVRVRACACVQDSSCSDPASPSASASALVSPSASASALLPQPQPRPFGSSAYSTTHAGQGRRRPLERQHAEHAWRRRPRRLHERLRNGRGDHRGRRNNRTWGMRGFFSMGYAGNWPTDSARHTLLLCVRLSTGRAGIRLDMGCAGTWQSMQRARIRLDSWGTSFGQGPPRQRPRRNHDDLTNVCPHHGSCQVPCDLLRPASTGYAGTWQSMGRAGHRLDGICGHLAIDGVCGDSAKCRVCRLPCHGRPRRHKADGDTCKASTGDFERQDISGEGASLKGADTEADEADEASITTRQCAHTLALRQGLGNRWGVRGFISIGYAGTWQSMGCAGIRLMVAFTVCLATVGPDAARPMATRASRAWDSTTTPRTSRARAPP